MLANHEESLIKMMDGALCASRPLKCEYKKFFKNKI